MISTNAGQILILRPKPIRQPRPQLRPRLAARAGKDHVLGSEMIFVVVMQRLDEAQIIDQLIDVRETGPIPHAPLCPHCFQPKGDLSSSPVCAKENFGLWMLAGSGLPSSRCSSGL